jgi:hypothetical protein
MQVDESVTKENIGKKQTDFLNWLQEKLKKEMQKPSYKNYVEQEKLKRTK